MITLIVDAWQCKRNITALLTSQHYSDTTGSESTPVSKEAPAIPTPEISPAVDAASESEKEEEASISLQPPTEQVNFETPAVCWELPRSEMCHVSLTLLGA